MRQPPKPKKQVQVEVKTTINIAQKVSLAIMMISGLTVASAFAAMLVLAAPTTRQIVPIKKVTELFGIKSEPEVQLAATTQEYTEELKKLAGNTSWLIELQSAPVASYLDTKKTDNNSSGSSASLSLELNAYESSLLSEHADFKSSLPAGITVKREFTATVNGLAVTATAEAISQIPQGMVARILPDYKVYPNLMDVPSIVHADDAWQLTDSQGLPMTGEGTTVAILDSGVDYTHPDFGSCTRTQFLNGECLKFAGGYNFWDNTADPLDNFGHGTHVASIAAGSGALPGIASAAKIYAYKVLGETSVDGTLEEAGTMSSLLAGLERAIDPNQDGNFSDHADVIHMSLGAPGSPQDLWSQMVDNAVSVGAIVTVSAGNSGSDNFTIGSPALAQNSIAVGATCKPGQIGHNQYCQNEVASFSSVGPTMLGNLKPDIVAPGVEICAAKSNFMSAESLTHGYPCFDDSHYSFSGTSMSGPAVAGVAALMKQAHPDWSPQQIKNTLKGTATDLGQSPYRQGSGLVNALAAVQADSPYPTAQLAKLDNFFVSDSIEIRGTAQSSDFDHYTLEYGAGLDPQSWTSLAGSQTPMTDGALGQLDASLVTGEEISVRLAVYDHENNKSVDQVYFIKRSDTWKKGWPQIVATDAAVHMWAPVMGDVNKDGKTEIVAMSQGIFESKVYVWDTNGNLLPGWPQSVNLHGGSNPALGDVDGDGYLEIVVKATSFLVERKSTVYVWRYDGQPLNSHWPMDIAWEYVSATSPVLSDIDNDNKEEIILSTTEGTAGAGHIKIWNEDGSEITGPWNEVGDMVLDPAVGDWDGDGHREIVFLTSNFKLYIWDAVTGALESGLPQQIDITGLNSVSASAPLIANIDHDQQNEVIIRTNINSGTTYTYDDGAFKKIETKSFGSPATSSAAIGFNQPLVSFNSPLVTDVDNDEVQEMISYNDGRLYAWESNGSIVPGWPKQLMPQTILMNMQLSFSFYGGAVGDADQDGLNELAVIMHSASLDSNSNIGSYVFLIDLNGRPAVSDWSTYRADDGHTGLYSPGCVNTCGDGLVSCGETCDDKNVTNGDGCSNSCQVETGWSCFGQSSSCARPNAEGRPIAPYDSDQSAPDMSDRGIVWADLRSGNNDVYYYDSQTAQAKQLTNNKSQQMNPVISGNRVVWEDWRNVYTANNPDIYMYDLSTNQENVITANKAVQQQPAIDGDKIVWADNRNGNFDIYLYDLTTQREKRLTYYAGHESSPDIYGDKVVYEDLRNGFQIFLYDLTTGQETQLSENSLVKQNPVIYGDKVAWSEVMGNKYKIMVYDLTDKTLRKIADNLVAQPYPSVYGHNVGWQDRPYGNYDVFIYDLDKNNSWQVTTNSHDQVMPVIWGERIIWADNRTAHYNIYSYDFFICGDTWRDGEINFLDIIYSINYLYRAGPAPYPLAYGNANGGSDGKINLLDVSYLINYLYRAGPAPVEQSGVCHSPSAVAPDVVTSIDMVNNYLLQSRLAQ